MDTEHIAHRHQLAVTYTGTVGSDHHADAVQAVGQLALPDAAVIARLARADGVERWRERNRTEGLPRPLYLRGVNITLPDHGKGYTVVGPEMNKQVIGEEIYRHTWVADGVPLLRTSQLMTHMIARSRLGCSQALGAEADDDLRDNAKSSARHAALKSLSGSS